MAASEIQEFYKNQTVFLTGATGFLGKLLILKLLNTCHDIKKIYTLIREKKGKTPQQRLDTLLDDDCFRSLKSQKPNFKEKVAVIAGDSALPNLGISPADWDLLKNEINCIMHICADIRFDRKLRVAAYNNVRAVQCVLDLAGAAKGLKAVVYLSTAYSNCNRKYEIDEKFYEPPMPAERLFDLLSNLDDDAVEEIVPELMGDWPNTYTFTKAIAEDVIRRNVGQLPVAVVRPSIVIGAVKEPEPGWLGAVQGFMAYIMGIDVGVIHTVFLNPDGIVAVVPCDYTVNNILAVAWSISRKKQLQIYNFTGSKENKLTWEKFLSYGMKQIHIYPTMRCVWWPFVVYTTSVPLLKFYKFWFYYVPFYLFSLMGRQSRLAAVYEKIIENIAYSEYFSRNFWVFENTNCEKLWEEMNETDQQLFKFNMEDLDWEKQMLTCYYFLRFKLLQDPPETLSKAKTKLFCLRILHYITIALLLYILYALIRFIFSLF